MDLCCFRFLLPFGVFLVLLIMCLIQTEAIEIVFYTSSLPSTGKCFPRLGCFNVTADFFHSTLRPINLMPASPEEINTQFILFTRNNQDSGQRLHQTMNATEIRAAGFSSTKMTRFIIHGFIDNQEIGVWLREMKKQLLKYDDCNVILVDWSGGNGLPYSQATANTRVVAAEIALLINMLITEAGLQPERCHLIGHSLGAHIAGYTGKRIGKLGRISGLDPAEPYFQYMPGKVRLDRKDALFVDIIHSDSKSIIQLGLGMDQAIGHLDFYPNGGQEQPGCTASRFISFITEGLIHGTRQFVACNHQRAIDYYIESLQLVNGMSQFSFTGFSCHSWQEFESGSCADCNNGMCAYLGIEANRWKRFKNDSKSMKMFMKTNDESPFMVHHYQVQIKLAQRPEAKTFYGFVWIKLFKNQSNHINEIHSQKLNEIARELTPGHNHMYLMTSKKHLDLTGKPLLTIRWEREVSMLKPNTWPFNLAFWQDSDETGLFVERVIVKEMRLNDMKVSRFCFNSTVDVKHKRWTDFGRSC